jgi:hypothetical protein
MRLQDGVTTKLNNIEPALQRSLASFEKSIISAVKNQDDIFSAVKTLEDELHVGNATQILMRLPVADGASHNSYRTQHDPLCLEGTREDLLKLINSWVEDSSAPGIFWLRGWAGSGKTTVARTIASTVHHVVLSFFFSKSGVETSRTQNFVTTLAVQLANQSNILKKLIAQAAASDILISGKSLLDQWTCLVLKPLSELQRSYGHLSVILVVDSLDECDNEKDVAMILSLFSQTNVPEDFSIFVTSRPEFHIRASFQNISPDKHQAFVLHDINPMTVGEDLTKYVTHHFEIIRQDFSFMPNWPGLDKLRVLVTRSCGLFIWAETACRFVRGGKRNFAESRLTAILERNTQTKGPEGALNEAYLMILQNAAQNGLDEEETDRMYTTLRNVFGCLFLLGESISLQNFLTILAAPPLQMDQDFIFFSLEDVHSIIDIPKDRHLPIRIHHTSLRDFMLDKKRCSDENLVVIEDTIHKSLYQACLSILVNAFGDHEFILRRVKEGKCDAKGTMWPRDGFNYACRFWVHHLVGANIDDLFRDTALALNILSFISNNVLEWTEILGNISSVDTSFDALDKLTHLLCTKEVGSAVPLLILSVLTGE